MRERAESGKEGKGSPTLFIAFVLVSLVNTLRVTFTAYGKLRNSQVEMSI